MSSAYTNKQSDDEHPHWFHPRALKPLAELNELLLEALTCEATAKGGTRLSLAEALSGPLPTLTKEARTRLAECPFAFVDAGFSDADRWLRVRDGFHPDNSTDDLPALPERYAKRLAHMTLTLAWSLARSNQDAAHVVLGMSQRCAAIIREIGLGALPVIAERHSHLIRPRWENRPDIWRELLHLAVSRTDRHQHALSIRAMEYFLTDLRRPLPLSGQNHHKGT